MIWPVWKCCSGHSFGLAKKHTGRFILLLNGEPKHLRYLIETTLKGLGELIRYRKIPGFVAGAALALKECIDYLYLKAEPPLTRYTYYLPFLDIAKPSIIQKAQTERLLSKMTIEEGIDNYVQHDQAHWLFPAGYCSSHSGPYSAILNENGFSRCLLIHHREKGYIYWYWLSLRDLRTVSVFLHRLATPMQMKKKTRSIIYWAWDWSSKEITIKDSSHLHLTISAEQPFPNAHFFVTQEVYEVYQNRNLKIWFLKSFCQLISKIGWPVSKADQRHPASPYRPTADLFKMEHPCFVHRWACEGSVFIWMSSNFIGADLLGRAFALHGKNSFHPWFRMIRRLIEEHRWNTCKMKIQVVVSHWSARFGLKGF